MRRRRVELELKFGDLRRQDADSAGITNFSSFYSRPGIFGVAQTGAAESNISSTCGVVGHFVEANS